MIYNKICKLESCKKSFQTETHNKLYCSDSCQEKAKRIRQNNRHKNNLNGYKRIKCKVCGKLRMCNEKGYCTVCSGKKFSSEKKIKMLDNHIGEKPLKGLDWNNPLHNPMLHMGEQEWFQIKNKRSRKELTKKSA